MDFNLLLDFDFSGIDWANLVLTPTPATKEPAKPETTPDLVYRGGATIEPLQPARGIYEKVNLNNETDERTQLRAKGITPTPASTPATTPSPTATPAPASPASVRAANENIKTTADTQVSAAESPVITNASAVANRFTSASITAQTREERMDELQRTREQRMASEAMSRAQSNPMANYAVRPDAPEADDNFIYYYSWIGGVNTGNWRLYRAVNTPDNQAKYGSRAIGGNTQATASSAIGANSLAIQPKPVVDKDGKITGYTGGGVTGGGVTGGGVTGGGVTGGGVTGGADGTTGTASNSTDVLKAMLRGMGFNSSIIDASTSFLSSLLKDGLDYDNAVAIFLNSKDYTTKNGAKLESPFYAEYGYLNEGLVRVKTPAELYNAVEGYKEINDKYKLNSKFVSKDYLKQYVKNNVTVAQLDERANTARLKAINSDPAYLESLRQLKFISDSTDLTDFFLDPKIGQETLEQKRATAAFSTEAVRRAGQGIAFDATRFEQTAAGLLGLGLNEAQIGASAAQGFENIAQRLKPTAKLASIYERMPTSELTEVQKELEAEEFKGTASERRKRLEQREIAEFTGQSGTARGVSLSRSRAGII
jgi:hypothetical protein